MLRAIHKGHEIHVGDKPLVDCLPMLWATGKLKKGSLTLAYKPRNYREEEEAMVPQHISTSLCFGKNRSRVRDALRAIISFVFDTFDLPEELGADFGAGATGEMVENLLPASINKDSWIQVEINPDAVEENRRRHPESHIMRGSYLDIEGSLGLRDSLKIATGLSSLDATVFLDRAMEEIRKSLRAGGFLLHVQDVRPGLGTGFKVMEDLCLRPPYQVELMANSIPLTFLIPGEGYVNVGELFRRNIGTALQNNSGMEILMNEWISTRKKLPPHSPGRNYFLNMYFEHNMAPFEDVSAVVTVARKK